MIGDSVWSIDLNLNHTDQVTYFSTRAGQGFNTALLDATSLKAIVSGVSTDVAGNAPFNGTLGGGQYDVSTYPTPGDTTSSAGKYWVGMDSLISLAQSYGFQVVFDVYDTYCGWFSTGFLDGQSPNSTANLTAFGNFLGQRYASKPVFWMVGNDYISNSTGNTNIAAIIDGIRQSETSHVMTLEMNPPDGDPVEAFGNATLRSRLTVNGIYEFNTGPYRTAYLAAYNRGDFGPIFNVETGYELNSGIGSTPATVRSGHYVMICCGSCGDLYGNERIGGAFAGGPFAADWVAQLTSQGGNEMSYFATFVNSIAWYMMVPDQTSTVFSSMGTPTDYSGAWATDGSLAIAYQPPTGAGTKSFTVDRSKFRASITARWFDPTNGTYTLIGSGISNSGSQTFTTSGNNSAGDNDWVIVLTA